MKRSFVVSIPDATLGGTMDWKKKIGILNSLGYEGVEFSIRDPACIDICAVEKELHKYKMEISAIDTGQAFSKDGLSLSTLDTDVRISAVNRIKKQIDFAARFDTQVIVGLVRGKTAKTSEKPYLWNRGYSNLKEGIKRICEYAAKKNIVLALEPINRYETSFLNNIDQTLEFMGKIVYKNLRILVDSFHMNIEEKDFVQSLIKTEKYLSHVHLADNNRMCPGKGHIDFRKIIRTLTEIGYAGYLSAEISVLPDFKTCSREYAENISKYL